MSCANKILRWERRTDLCSPPLKNHTTTLVDESLYIFGGYDGRKNYSSVQVFDTKSLEWIQKSFCGNPPESRNGHTATLVKRSVVLRGDRVAHHSSCRQIYIIGGWIESGPSAGRDVHRLDIDSQCWIPTPQSSRAPVCNMHTSDYIPHLDMILVFRGGDGREYLNDLHTYDIRETLSPPPPCPLALMISRRDTGLGGFGDRWEPTDQESQSQQCSSAEVG
jgi:leucine-zipper-like transcriptional regulator 1